MAEQDLLGDCGDVCALLREDVADGQASRAEQRVAGEVVQVPAIGADGAMEPDGVVKAGTHPRVVGDRGAVGVQRDDSVGREVVGQVGQRACLRDGIVAELIRGPEPACSAPRAEVDRRCSIRTAMRRPRDETSLERRTPRFRRCDRNWQWNVRLDDGLDVRRVFGPLERGGHRQDRTDLLPGQHPARDEGPSVADPFHFQAGRLVVIAPADEIRVQRVHAELWVDGVRGCPQGLGHDLPAVEASPGVTGTGGDVRVGAVRFEGQDLVQVHGQ